MQLIKNFYNGQISLPVSFWIYFFFINLILKLGTKTFTSNYGKPDPVIGIIWLLIISIYSIFSIIGTWRSSDTFKENYGGWATFTKVILIIVAFNEFFRIGIIIFAIATGNF